MQFWGSCGYAVGSMQFVRICRCSLWKECSRSCNMEMAVKQRKCWCHAVMGNQVYPSSTVLVVTQLRMYSWKCSPCCYAAENAVLVVTQLKVQSLLLRSWESSPCCYTAENAILVVMQLRTQYLLLRSWECSPWNAGFRLPRIQLLVHLTGNRWEIVCQLQDINAWQSSIVIFSYPIWASS